MFVKSLKILAGSLLVCALAWALVLGWWQSNDYEPNRIELALYLGALPLAIIGGYLFLHAFIEHLKHPPAPTEATPQLQDADPLALKQAAQSAAERARHAYLVEAALCSPGGASPEEILDAVTDVQRPLPNEKFQDSEGFPVFVAEIDQLDLEKIVEAQESLPPALDEIWQREDLRRALSALDEVIAPLRDGILNQIGQTGIACEQEIIWLMPAHWPTHLGGELMQWLKSRHWPDAETSNIKFAWHPTASDGASMKTVDDIVLRLGENETARKLTLLLAATSMLDEALIADLDQHGKLFTNTRQDQAIPGEGAIALLFGSAAILADLPQQQAIEITRINQAPRDKSIDAPGRTNGALIQHLANDLIALSETPAASITGGIGDTDHRHNRSSEASQSLSELFPHWDLNSDWMPLGTVTGNLAPFGGLFALACARSKVIAAEGPVLCLSNQHATERALALLRPRPATPPDQPSST